MKMLRKKKKAAESSEVQYKVKNPKNKIRTTGGLKLLRFFAWGFILFVIFIGIFQIVRDKRPVVVQHTYKYDIDPSESDSAKTFAENFVKQFLTYNPQDPENYTKRIGSYVVSDVKNNAINFTQAKMISKVTSAQVWEVKKLNRSHSNITVRAEITLDPASQSASQPTSTTASTTSSAVSSSTEINKTVFVSVPIQYVNNAYLVDDYPTFAAAPSSTSGNLSSYEGKNSVSQEDNVKLKDVVANFFNIYATGNQDQIDYYMLPGSNEKKVKGYEGQYTFNQVENLNAYYEDKTDDKLFIITLVSFKDKGTNTTFEQRYNLELQKKIESGKDRWYICKFDMRGNVFK